jgi:hypothetical protein
MTVCAGAIHSAAPAHRAANPVGSDYPISIGSGLAGGPPNGVFGNLSNNVSLEEVELRMSAVEVYSANVEIGGAAVKLSSCVIVRDHVASCPPFQHDGHVRALNDVVFDQAGTGLKCDLNIGIMSSGTVQKRV